MAERQGGADLAGGIMQGFVGAKNKQRELAMLEEYKKANSEHLKAQTKSEEAKVNKQLLAAEWMQSGKLPPFLEGLNKIDQGQSGQAGGLPLQGGQQAPMPNIPGAPPGPVSQYTPGQPAPQSLPEILAQGQNPLAQTGSPVSNASLTGMIDASPAGQRSYRNNNFGNIEYRNQPDAVGVEPAGRFAQYATPEAGLNAAVDLIQRKYAGMSIRDGMLAYAPPKNGENANIYQRINQVSQQLGVSPDTPIGNLPLAPFMQALVTGESPTKINPAIYGQHANTPISQLPQGVPIIQVAQGQPQQGGLGQPGQQFQQPQTPPQTGPSFPKKTGISGLPVGSRLALDVFFKQMFDLNTGFSKEGGRRYTISGNPYDGWKVFDQNEGGVVQSIPPTMQKFEPARRSDQRGTEEEYLRPSNVVGPIGQPPPSLGGAGAPGGGQGNITKYGPQDTVQPVPDATKQELQKGRDALQGLTEMRNLAAQAPDDLFGYWSATKHKIYQDEDSALKATARSVLDATGKAPTPEATAFRVKLEAFNANIRHELYAGNLTEQEATRYQKQALAATTRDQYLAVLDSMQSTLMTRQQDRILEVAGTPAENLQRRATQTLPGGLTPQNTRGTQVTSGPGPSGKSVPSLNLAPPANALKEGVHTTFGNGQTWTLKGGKPVRVQ